MVFTLTILGIAGTLFFAMLTLLEIGRRLGMRRMKTDPEGLRSGIGAVEGAVFGLFGLLVAFTFSGASTRLDVRRQWIVEEANAIGTAYLRIDLLPEERRTALRDAFRRYVDARLEAYRRLPDFAAVERGLAEAAAVQSEIWSKATEACREADPQASLLLLPALNQMFDITTTRTMAARTHPPQVVFVMLLTLSLVGSLMAGYDMGGAKLRSWLHMVGFAAIVAVTIYVILDIEYPRMGLIRVDVFDQALIDVRRSMK